MKNQIIEILRDEVSWMTEYSIPTKIMDMYYAKSADRIINLLNKPHVMSSLPDIETTVKALWDYYSENSIHKAMHEASKGNET